jgi:5-formyltetrahydrofolate cyclo-ligase
VKNDDGFTVCAKKILSGKKELRRDYLACRNSLSKAEISDKSRLIIKRLESLDLYREADAILTYVSFGSEAVTTGLIEKLFAKKEKRVFVPKVLGIGAEASMKADASMKAKAFAKADTFREMQFYEITDFGQLAAGYYGILEPAADEMAVPLAAGGDEMKCLVIMPGVVFDSNRGRLGYGKGYYDRFLKQNPHYQTVALAYECQITSAVPQGENDIRPMMILTETRLIK